MRSYLYLIMLLVLTNVSCSNLTNYQKENSKAEFRKITSELKNILEEETLADSENLKGNKYNVELLGVSVQDVCKVIYGNILNIPFVIDNSVYFSQSRLDIVIKKKISHNEIKYILNTALIKAGFDVTEENKTIYISKNRDDKEGILNNNKILTIYQLNNITSEKAINRIKELIKPEIKSLLTYSDKESDILFYSVDERHNNKIKQILKKIDIAEKQIFLEIIIIENSRDGILNTGLAGYLQKTVKSLDIKFSLFGTLSQGHQLSIINDTNLFNLIIGFLEQEKYLSKIANPHFVIKSGMEANLNIGDQIPVLASTIIIEGNTEQNITYQSTGINIKALPEIIGSNIHINLDIEISAGEINKLSTINSPSISRRSIKTKLICKNSQAVLIGGIYQTRTYQNNQGFPLNNKIIKEIINMNTKEKSNIELLFYIRPVILNDDNIKELI